MQYNDRKAAYDSVAAGLETSRSKLEMVSCSCSHKRSIAMCLILSFLFVSFLIFLLYCIRDTNIPCYGDIKLYNIISVFDRRLVTEIFLDLSVISTTHVSFMCGVFFTGTVNLSFIIL